MVKRALLIAVAVAALVALLIYSQQRTEPRRVSGFVEADEIRLGSRVGGRVSQVLVEEGDSLAVKPGDDTTMIQLDGQPIERRVLVVLEPYDLLQRRAEAQARVAERQADYKRLTAGFRIEEIDQAKSRLAQLEAVYEKLQAGPRPQEIKAAEARLKVAEAQLELAEAAHRRTVELVQRNASTQEALDAAEEALRAARWKKVVREQELSLMKEGTRKEELEEARAHRDEAAAALKLAQAGYRAEEVAQAKAALDAAKAALKALDTQIDELNIVSPITDGTVESLDLRPGDLVSPSAPVLSIIDKGRLWVRAYVPENRLDLKLGQTLEVAVDSFPGERFKGELVFIARQAEFTPSNVQTIEERSKQVFRIKVMLREGLDRLRPGMAADVYLPPREAK